MTDDDMVFITLFTAGVYETEIGKVREKIKAILPNLPKKTTVNEVGGPHLCGENPHVTIVIMAPSSILPDVIEALKPLNVGLVPLCLMPAETSETTIGK